MSAGGVFKLIANDGKADRMIMATQLLNQRINDVMCARRKAGAEDDTPTLVDLERTHILFVNAHFKPYAAIGYEYNKVRPNTGTPALGNSISFSIPQFGDFFHDMVIRQTLSAFSSSVLVAPAAGVEDYPAADTDWNNVDPLLSSTYSLVDAFGNAVGDGSDYRNLVRYCEYPGERLNQTVKFDVNGNPLDEYTDTTVNMLRKFTIGTDKLSAYKQLVGQEVERQGYGGPKMCPVADPHNGGEITATTVAVVSAGIASIPQMSVTPVSTTAAAYLAAEFPDNAWDRVFALPAAFHVDAAAPANQLFAVAAAGGAVTGRGGYVDVMRSSIKAVDGPQTPKYEQPALEIWNKLRFWFNDDVRLAIPSVSIPFGQRFITVTYAAQAQLAFEFPGLYVRQVKDSGLVGALITRTITYRPWVAAGTISDIALSGVEMYVNNIFVNPEIHDIFIKRVGFSLIRVYRRHIARTTTDATGEVLLSNLKWPIECMFVALRPTFNQATTNANQWRDWHRMGKVVTTVCDSYDFSETPMDLAGVPTPSLVSTRTRVGQIVPDSYIKELKTIDTLSLTAHGVAIHDSFSEKFFHAYNPFHYGGAGVVTPDDEGALMVNFSLFPRSYQPSGHINISRAREFYISWVTRYVAAATTADLIAIAIAINFLLITDGSAVLRYAT